MQIYMINPRKDFSHYQLEKLDNMNTIFIGDISQLEEEKDIYSNCEKIIAVSPDYTNWEFSNELINMIPNIKALCLGTTTYDYIDLKYCEDNNILVTNIPRYATESVAEYLMFLAINLAKKLPLQLKNNNIQDFKKEYMQMLIEGKQAGIIGLGNIGNKVAEICSNMNMKVVYWSKKTKNSIYIFNELEELFEKSDFIFLTLSINDETKTLITEELLNKMKTTANFISGTGKALHNHNMLIEKIEKGELFGYALEEPNKNILDYKGNIMVTSEYAWYTYEATEKRMDIWIETIKGILDNDLKNVIK